MKITLQTIRNSITQKGVFGLFILMIGSISLFSQNISNYTVARTTGNTYTSITGGTSATSWRNGNSTDDNMSETQPIGFPFIYMGQTYTGFRISTNGYLTLNTTSTAIGNGTGTYGYQNTQFSATGGTVITLAGFYDDLQTASNSTTLTDLNASMKYLVTGTAGSRIFTMEWINMQDFSTTSTSSFNWQVRLYEATGVIEYNYGVFTLSNSSTITTMSYSLGINGPTISGTPTTSELLTQQTVNTGTFSNVASNALGGATPGNMPAAGSRITFTPPTPALTAPTSLVVSNVTGSSMKLDWTDNATGEFSYAVLLSTNGGVSYNLYSSYAANTQTATLTGLLPGTTYSIQVVAVDLAGTSTPLSGSQLTLPPGNITTTAIGGLWSAATTWVGGNVPTPFDTAIVASGATLTVDIAATIAKMQLNSTATVFLNNTLVDSSDLIIGTSANFNGFFGTAGRQLTVRGNITNAGTLNMAMPGGVLLLNGITSQTISGAGTFGIIPTLTVNNLTGVVCNANATIGAVLNLTNGVVSGTGSITLGNATFSPTFSMISTGGRISSTVVSGLTGILPGNATFTYNAPTPIAAITTGNELNIAASANLNVTFNAIGGGNYILGTNINVNNLTVNDTIDVGSNTVTLNGVGTFGAVQNITGAGTFTMGANATIVTAHLLGITAAPSATGSIQTATRNYNTNGSYTYNGATGQVTGDGLPATLTGGTVTINTGSGTLLSQSTVFNNLTLSTNLLLGSNAATVNGVGNIGTLAITGAGAFTGGATSRLLLNSTATAGVLQTAASLGNIQNTGGRTYTPGLDIVIGGSAVGTGDNFPITGVDSLVLNQTTVVVLTAATSVNTLYITNTGRMTTTPVNILTVAGTSATNVARVSTGYIDGPLTRTIGVGAVGNFAFPLGVGAVGNLEIDIINPVVTGSSVTLTAIARSLPTGGTAGTGLTGLTNTRYWAITPVAGGVLSSVGNIRIFESTAATLGGTSKKIGFTTSVATGAFNTIGGQLDSANVNILSSLTVPAFGVGSDSTFFVLGNGTASGAFTGGTFTVGPTGTYKSLTAAVATINENVSLTAPVILEFQTTYNPAVETYPIVFRATLPTTLTNSITIRPSSGVSSAINFAGTIFTSTSLIDFNGGKNIIIDGRPGGTGTNRYLSFTQQNIGAFPTFRFINEAQNDTLRYITVAGQNTNSGSGLILIGTTTGTGGNSNLGINNCTINGLSNTLICINGSGTAAPADNKNVSITNNNIFDFFVNGGSPTAVIAGAGSSAWTISSNNFYQTSIRNSYSNPVMNSTTNFRAIQLLNSATNAIFTVNNNRVGGNIPGIPGSVFILGDSISNLGHLFRPMDFSNAGPGGITNVQGNIISDITLYTNGTDNFTGIGALQTGVYSIGDVTPNVVGSATINGSIKIFSRTSSAGFVRGFQLTAIGGGSMQNNIVSGIDLMVQGAQAAGGSIILRGIEVAATFTAPVTVSGNTVGSTTLANSIQGLASSLGATGIQGIILGGASGAAITATNNTVSNLSVFNQAFSTNNSIKGIYITGASSVSTTVTGNSVRNIRIDAPNNTLGDNSVIIGIANSSSGTGSQFISNNTVHSLRSTFNGPVANVVMGLYYNSTNTGGLSRVDRNVIHSLETGSTNTLTLQTGVNIGTSSTTMQLINNFVRLGVNVDGTTNNANATLYGILKQNTNNTSIIHNTVYIAGSPAATDTVSLSAAFFKTASAAIDTVMNNVFTNARSNASGAGEHYAMYINNVTGLRSNANLYRANGTGGILFRNGFTRIATLQSWRSIQKPFEQRSAVGNPSFNAGITNGAATINFTLAAVTSAATAAIPVSYITTDLGGNLRSATPAIGSYDVGLSALTASTDVYTPIITITALGNRSSANTTVNAVVVTDIGTGVPTTGATAPKLWYRNSTTASAWASVAPTSFTGTGNNVTFVYNFVWSAIGGAPSVNDRIKYYFVAADAATAPNIWYSNYTAIDPIHSSVAVQGTAPANADSFLIASPLPVAMNVPVDYPSLTGVGGLFNAINNATLAANTVVTISADVNETGVNELRSDGLSGFKLTIQPDATLRTLWGNSTTSMLRFNGVSNVVIDGGATKNLRLLDSIGSTPSATVGATIEFLGGCTTDTLVNCIVEGNGSSTSRGTIVIGAGTNKNIVIANNDIRAANNLNTNRPAIGVFSSNVNNSSIIIGGVAARAGGNTINDFTSSAISITSSGDGIVIGSTTVSTDGNKIFNTSGSGAVSFINIASGNNHSVANNKLYQTAGTYTGVFTGISVTGGGLNNVISDNSIGGTDVNRAGLPITTSSDFNGIIISASNLIPQSVVKRNLISNLRSTSTGSLSYGILSSGGNVMIGGTTPADGNTIGNSLDSLTSSNSIHGIGVSAGTVIVQYNTIQGIVYQDADFERAVGIYVLGSSTDTILNNTISNIRHYSNSGSGSLTTTFCPAGIYIVAGTNHLVRGNVISNIGTNPTTVAYPVFGIKYAVATGSLITGNRIFNLSNKGAGTGTNGATIVGIQCETGNAVFSNNQVTLGNGVGNDAQIFGIRDDGTGTTDYRNNTVHLSGAGVGANASFGMYRNSTSVFTAVNNFVYTNRTNSSTGVAFAMGSTNAVTNANFNYNLLVCMDTAAIARIGGAPAGWNAFNGLYTAGPNTNWAEKNSVVVGAGLFTDPSVGDLGIVTTNPLAWYANGKGIAITGLSGDFSTISGVRSAAIATGATDIGSVEFLPTALPPLAYADKVPAGTDSTQFFFGSRMVAKVKWGVTGSLPFSVDLRYYSGVNPSNTKVGTTFTNAYWDFQPTGGSGYTYDLTLMTDSSVLGSISNLANLDIAKYSGTGVVWTNYTNSALTAVKGTVTSAGLTTPLGIFTGTDGSNNPLPVKLTSFTASVESKDVLVSWTTTSEDNNKGFEVERSVDGKTFEFAGFVEGAGNSNKVTEYTLLDKEAFAKTNVNVLYYRLKQIDFDGNVSYSNTVLVSINADASNGLSVYPNPFTSDYTVSFTAKNEGTATVQLFDLQGKMVNNQIKDITKGFNTMPVNNLEGLHTGIYFVKVTIEGESHVMKLVKN